MSLPAAAADLSHDPAAAELLGRNLAALKAHRPAAYRTLVRLTKANPYRPVRLPTGMTVARVTAEGALAPLCADPAAQVQAAMKQLQPACQKGDAIAVMGVADGNVLAALAAQPPKLFMDRQQTLYLIEPDPYLLLACLLAHDFTGPLGPIEQPRVLWYLGPTWHDALRLDLVTDRYLPFPAVNVKQTTAGTAIERSIVAIFGELSRLDAQASADVSTYYAARTPEDFAAALAGTAGRKPRVLLLTTRLSTVLQHSTRDADDAFRRLGCDTALIIEPSPFHALTRFGIRRTIAEFKPDLVLQIDHHRFEHGDLFPPNLPFVNWIQDLLPHLMTPQIGPKLGPADFSLTPSLQRWVDDFAYPARQCLEFRKLTRIPSRPAARHCDESQVVYISNWSQTPGQMTDELLAGTSGIGRDVITVACTRMIETYAAGDSLPSVGDVRRLIQRVLKDLDATAPEALIRQTTTRLADRLNNVLYRQQGLTWAQQACQALGLRLEIYGNGWDKNPDFAANARGPVAYGGALETLTGQAAVNLILEPFMCLSHQRLLDALVAGGFCLVRDHSANHTATEWIDLLSRAGPNATDAKSLHASLRGDDLARYAANFAECERLDSSPDGGIDHVATVCRLQQTGFFPETGPVLPLLSRVAFTTPDGLAAQLSRAVRDAGYRADVSAVQRRCIESRFSYQSGMGRVLQFVSDRLATQAVPRPAKAA